MKQSLAIYRRLMGYTRPYLRGFGLAMVGMVVAAATEPVFPALMKPLLDRGFVDKSGIELWYVPVAIIGIFVVRGIATFTSNYALAWVANKVLADMRREMFAHMLHLPAADFEREASGLLISKIVFEVNNVTVAATRVLTTVVRDSLVIVGLLEAAEPPEPLEFSTTGGHIALGGAAGTVAIDLDEDDTADIPDRALYRFYLTDALGKETLLLRGRLGVIEESP